jgi:hypothetical protein
MIELTDIVLFVGGALCGSGIVWLYYSLKFDELSEKSKATVDKVDGLRTGMLRTCFYCKRPRPARWCAKCRHFVCGYDDCKQCPKKGIKP